MDIQQSINSIEYILNNRWMSLLTGTGVTILINVITISIGLLMGIAMFRWRYKGSKSSIVTSNWVTLFLTYIPAANWLLVVFYIFFRGRLNLNFISAIVALSILFGFDVFSNAISALEQISKGEREAAISMGYDKDRALKKIYIPRAMPYFLEGLKPIVRTLIQNTAFVELINVADIQFVSDKIAAEDANAVVPLLLSTVIYVLLEVLCDKGIDKLLIKCRYEKSEETIKENINKGRF